ncbi:MAG: nucleotide exchange factor GrpE [Gemmatimonadota bacterium]|nr:MAG: nucleotide exchange factor GrpE [Gemmatimonadota bacterium]
MQARKRKKTELEDHPRAEGAEPAEKESDGPDALVGEGDALDREAGQLDAQTGPPAVEPEVEGEPAEQVIEQLAAELRELEDRHLRLVAEFDNYRKRTLRERAQQEGRAQADIVRQLLEPLDDLGRVSELGSTDHDAAAILEGVQLVERKLLRVLERVGLRPIEAIGEPFNPELHDAMVTERAERPEEDDIVSQELAKGYLFKDILLRPSMVAVKQYDPDAAGGLEDNRAPEDAAGESNES